MNSKTIILFLLIAVVSLLTGCQSGEPQYDPPPEPDDPPPTDAPDYTPEPPPEE